MKNRIISTAFLLVALATWATVQSNAKQIIPPSLLPELLALNGDLETAQKPKYLSPTAMVASPVKKYIYIAEQYMKQVAKAFAFIIVNPFLEARLSR